MDAQTSSPSTFALPGGRAPHPVPPPSTPKFYKLHWFNNVLTIWQKDCVYVAVYTRIRRGTLLIAQVPWRWG